MGAGVISCCPWCGAEYGVADVRCRDCRLSVADPPAPTLPEGYASDDEELDDDVGFELDDWSPGERGRLSSWLRDREIRFRWEPGLTLVVQSADEELVDALLDDIESRVGGWHDTEGEGAGDPRDWDGDGDWHDEWDDDRDDDGDDRDDERAQAAMGDLFVAADRLVQRPEDDRSRRQLRETAAIVRESSPPFGFEPATWQGLQDLAKEAMDATVDDATVDDATVDEPAVHQAASSEAASGNDDDSGGALGQRARALRDALRPYV